MKNFSTIVINLFMYVWRLIANAVRFSLSFIKRIVESILLMSRFEKRLSLALVIIAILFFGQICRENFINNTKLAPASGGTYKEVFVGELKYLNPILPVSDNDKSVSGLVFSGLVRIGKDNNVENDLAISRTVSENGLSYTFVLRDDAYFHDGKKIVADDVIYTIDQVKNPINQSPLYDAWMSVEAYALNDQEIVLELPRAYGPFIFNCDFGVLPSHLSPEEFNKKVVGTGPYKVSKIVSKDGKISDIKLEKHDKFYLGSPLIEKVEVHFEKDKLTAESYFQKEKYSAIIGGEGKTDEAVNEYLISNNKKLGLVLNTRDVALADKSTRGKIVNKEKFDELINIKLVASNCEMHRKKAEELKKEYEALGVNLDINYLDPVEYKEAIENKNFGMILYGFDFHHDRDPYTFWHSSQLNKQNLAGYSDKKNDIFLEDTRMILNAGERNAKYDQFFSDLMGENVVVYYDLTPPTLVVKGEIKGIDMSNKDTEGKYYGIEKWYIKEKRVSK